MESVCILSESNDFAPACFETNTCKDCTKYLENYKKEQARKLKNREAAKRSREKANQRFSDVCSDNKALEDDFLQMEKKRVKIDAVRESLQDNINKIKEQIEAFKAFKAKMATRQVANNTTITNFNNTNNMPRHDLIINRASMADREIGGLEIHCLVTM